MCTIIDEETIKFFKLLFAVCTKNWFSIMLFIVDITYCFFSIPAIQQYSFLSLLQNRHLFSKFECTMF